MHTITKRRAEVAVNASSMADIAFLLLAFFLVSTTIKVDRGILVKLPSIEDQDIISCHPRNIFSVKINFNGELLVRGERVRVEQLKDKAKEFIMNPQKNDNLAIAPNRAIILLQNDRSTSYNIYVSVYNELKAAYNELWEEAAYAEYGMHFDGLSRSKRKVIQSRIPLVISEGEVVDLK